MIDDLDPTQREHRLGLARGRALQLGTIVGSVLGEPLELVDVTDGTPPLALYRMRDRMAPAVPMSGRLADEAQALAEHVRLAIAARPPERRRDDIAVWLGPSADVSLRDLERGQYVRILERDQREVLIRAIDRRGVRVQGRASLDALLLVIGTTAGV